MISRLIVLVTVFFVLSSCSSGSSTTPVQPPAHVVSDEIVVPPDIQPAFYQIEEWRNGDILSAPRLYKPEVARVQPLDIRRAYIYYQFQYLSPGSRDPSDQFWIHTMPGTEHEFDGIIQRAASRYGLTVLDQSWSTSWDEPPGDLHSSTYELKFDQALSVGEIAWTADQIFTEHSDQLIYIEPVTYIYPASL